MKNATLRWHGNTPFATVQARQGLCNALDRILCMAGAWNTKGLPTATWTWWMFLKVTIEEWSFISWQGMHKLNKNVVFRLIEKVTIIETAKGHCNICLVVWFVSLHLGTTQVKVALPVLWPLLQEVYGTKLQSLNFTEPHRMFEYFELSKM